MLQGGAEELMRAIWVSENSAAPRVLVNCCKTRVVSEMEPGRGPLVLKKSHM
jgi:hypothetical protein